jgi:peptidoglycan hydrolase-like protein with peptidoglycan-binding domain
MKITKGRLRSIIQEEYLRLSEQMSKEPKDRALDLLRKDIEGLLGKSIGKQTRFDTRIGSVQYFLMAAGYPLPSKGSDGLFGPETEGAIKSFQEDADIEVTGVLNDDTLSRMSVNLDILASAAQEALGEELFPAPSADDSTIAASGEILKGAALLRNTDFQNKVRDIANRLGVEVNELISLFGLETGGKYDPSIQNSIGATGLIQFMPTTAKGLGTSARALSRMSALQQLDYVYTYLDQGKKPYKDVTDLYMQIFYPRARSEDAGFVIGSERSDRYAKKVAQQNPYFSNHGAKEYITKADVIAKVKKLASKLA